LCAVFGLASCGPAPTPPPAPPPPIQLPPTDPPEPEPEIVEPAPTAPSIPAAPLTGEIDGVAFELSNVARAGTALRFGSTGEYVVTIVFFGDRAQTRWDIAGEVPFGSPHIHVRTPGAATVIMEGYELLLELEERSGGIRLMLPDGRGSLSGRFSIS
jgi:hypothetical protein